ncbi:hypothetical protein NPIL_554391 [Nephila pilipes]|uniref:Uncharacterized protein n=1 Tax=Nephila pilipes TaxID=299642 RepID=A0A8X6PVM3_NEPPI|nr:hypothetical protein NPIL_554391 [Nephila pilipes]
MADLSAARVNSEKAFIKGGMDFVELFLITPRRGRGVKTLKMHVYVFVCFTTKAIHLELGVIFEPKHGSRLYNVLSLDLWGHRSFLRKSFPISLVEIEAVQNSRPLVVTSNDPNEFSVITHCPSLIGSELKRVPEPDYYSEKISIRER